MKYLKNYDSVTDYNAAVNTPAKKTAPGITIVEGNTKINPFANTNFGDIVFYDKRDGLIKSASTNAYTGGLFHILSLVPIGVVAVPGKYSPDNIARIVSLVNMSVKTPDTGTIADGSSDTATNAADMSMYWGGYGVDLGLTNYSSVPKVNPLTGASTGTTDWMRIPSDISGWGGYTDPVSGDKYYFKNYSGDSTVTSGEDRFGPSPFLADGSKNPLFYASGLGTNDFNGRANTDTILNAVTVSGWQTSSTLTNNSDSGNYPPAMSCWRYSTSGTSQGDWYLPAEGELSFLVARRQAINAGVLAVKNYGNVSAYTIPTGGTTVGEWCWSSSEFSSTYARYVYLYGGDVSGSAKSSTGAYNRVRSFIALNPFTL